MLRRGVIIFVLVLFKMGAAWAAHSFPWQSEADFLAASEVFALRTPPQRQVDRFILSGQIADGYYVYRKSLRLEDVHGKAVGLESPSGMQHQDEFFGETEIYTGDAIQLSFSDRTQGPVVLHWQGCAKAGICYPPQSIKVDLPERRRSLPAAAEVPVSVSTSSVGGSKTAIELGDDQAISQRLATLGALSGMLLFFGFGLLLSFTPCVLPMIPIVSTMIIGSQAKPRRAFMLSLSYVLAMAFTYAAVGGVAGIVGTNLQAKLQSPWLLGTFAGLFALLAASLFGMFELRLPVALMNRLHTTGHNRSNGSILGAAALGVLSALLIGPCMTAPLAGALLYISQTGSALVGGAALFALGLGMGLPLLAMAVFGARILPRPGPWMNRVRVAFGYLMCGMAILMLARFLPNTTGLLLWGALGLAVSVGLVGWIHAITLQHRLSWILAFGAALIGLWSIIMLIGAASGGDSLVRPLHPLRSADGVISARSHQATVKYVNVKSVQDVDHRIAEASTRGQWTLIDFYADWCISCHVIERNVFGNPAVIKRLAGMQVLRADVTRNDATDQALMKHWEVLGPPTLILIAPNGQEVRAQRMVGELDARSFISHLDASGAL